MTALGTHPLDPDSAEWLRALAASDGEREAAYANLHAKLLRIARGELSRRGAPIAGPELDDLAHQAAADAIVSIRRRLTDFRGESRFTTWAYAFVVLEVSAKLGRHFWRVPRATLDAEAWDRLPDHFGLDPARESEWRELVSELQRGVDQLLSERQRRVFVAIVLNEIPLDALVHELGSSRNAIYKTLYDARRKLRALLVETGHLEARMNGLELFLMTDPSDAGCAKTMRLLPVYVDATLAGEEPERRHPDVAAHLRACPPCEQDRRGLLAACLS